MLVACTGTTAPGGGNNNGGGGPDIEDPKPEPPKPEPPKGPQFSAECQPESPGDLSKFAAVPDTRRISAQQYINGLRMLTNNPQLKVQVDPDPNPEGNVTLPTGLEVSREWVELAEENSWLAAPQILAELENDLNCQAGQNGCLDKIIDELSIRAWRRPIEGVEKERMQALAAAVAREHSQADVPEAVVAAFLQSPQLIHRNDIPKGEVIAPGLRRIDDWQYAESLALFLWRSQPDQTLLDAAARGDLSDPVKLSEQVERMLSDPKTERLTNHMVDQWLATSGLESTNKDEGNWNETMAKAARLDSEKVFASIMLDPDSTFADLFDHTIAYVTPGNAELFGMQMAVGEAGRMVTLTAEQRSGVLTHNSFLTAHSKVKGSSGIKRGNTILKQFMCIDLTLPADVVIPDAPKDDAFPTERERLAIHSESPACSACHAAIDPPGLALELWDGIGRPRTTENGATIDASGVLSISGGAEPFVTPQEMFALMSEDSTIKECFIDRWYDEATGTEARRATEPCGFEGIHIAADDGELHLRTLLAELVQHPSFWLRKEVAQP